MDYLLDKEKAAQGGLGEKRMKKAAIIAATTIALAGCSVTSAVDPVKAGAQAGEAPVNYKAIIIDDAKNSYFDPYSIRSAELTQPFLQNHSTLGHFWAVCVKANGKNRMGGYVGVKTEAYVFRNGTLLQKSGHPESYCGGAQYAPFPELENIT